MDSSSCFSLSLILFPSILRSRFWFRSPPFKQVSSSMLPHTFLSDNYGPSLPLIFVHVLDITALCSHRSGLTLFCEIKRFSSRYGVLFLFAGSHASNGDHYPRSKKNAGFVRTCPWICESSSCVSLEEAPSLLLEFSSTLCGLEDMLDCSVCGLEGTLDCSIMFSLALIYVVPLSSLIDMVVGLIYHPYSFVELYSFMEHLSLCFSPFNESVFEGTSWTKRSKLLLLVGFSSPSHSSCVDCSGIVITFVDCSDIESIVPSFALECFGFCLQISQDCSYGGNFSRWLSVIEDTFGYPNFGLVASL